MDKSPDDQNRRLPAQERLDKLMDDSFNLLTSRETQIENFDEDRHGNIIQQLNLSLDVPEDSVLHRFGYGSVEMSYVPATDIDDDAWSRPEIVTLMTYAFDKETCIDHFSLIRGLDDGMLRLEVVADESSPLFDDEETPLGYDASVEDVLRMDSVIHAMREHVTLDQDNL